MEQKRLIKQKNKLLTGFTIIELLVVIAIIAVLGGIVLTNVMSFIAKAKIARANQDVKSIEKALILFYTQYGDYPYNPNIHIWDGTPDGCDTCISQFYSSQEEDGIGDPWLKVGSCTTHDNCPNLSEFYKSDWVGHNADYFVKNGFYYGYLWDNNGDGKIGCGIVAILDSDWNWYGQKYILCQDCPCGTNYYVDSPFQTTPIPPY
ncbi:type II secretion system GspH family protein [Patescibacteria group bacterium]|nr:type II secretion system GspH family protein [Patescibacteria group bacterium]